MILYFSNMLKILNFNKISLLYLLKTMTVIFSKKCELALQAVLYLAHKDYDAPTSALEISEEIGTPKEFTSKILQMLIKCGIVGSRKGKSGGFYLARPAKEIRLIDIVEAIDGTDVFHRCVLGFPNCSNDEPCPVHDEWGKLREEALRMLSARTLEELRHQTIAKIEAIKHKNKTSGNKD